MNASRRQWNRKLGGVGGINFEERNLKMEREKQINEKKKKRLYFTQFYHTKRLR
jgi:hypothetical protein